MKVTRIDEIPRKELRGQSVLVRIDVEEEKRLRDSLPTITFLSQAGAKVIIATHWKQEPNSSPPDQIGVRLAELLGQSIRELNYWKGKEGLRAVTHLGQGEIMMIENLSLEPGEEADDEKLADDLAHLCDIYCNDAFALSNEVRASTVGVAKRARLAVAGIAFERELKMLQGILDEPLFPLLSILGGELTRDKLLLAEDIARRSDRIFIGGQLSFPFLIAKGLLSSSAVVTDEMVSIADRMLNEAKENRRILATPVDFIVTDRVTFEKLSRRERFVLGPPLKNVKEDEIEPDQIICDIGKVTQWSWSDNFGPARTIFWHGPLGISEIDLFQEGSRFLAKELVGRTRDRSHHSLVCGRSLVPVIRNSGIETERINHLTPAGRASLNYFAGRSLPAVDVLSKKEKTKHEKFRILIPLNGSASDRSSVYACAEMVARASELFLLHVRSGPDEERYSDLSVALKATDGFKERTESERIFARANAILASRGLISSGQLSVQGKPEEIILRYANRIGAEIIVMAENRGHEPVNAKQIIDHATCAVLVAKQREEKTTKTQRDKDFF